MYSQRKDPSLGIKPGSMLAILRYLIIDISISDTYVKANTRITNREYLVYSRALLIFGLELIPLEMEFILSISVMFLREGVRSLPGLILIGSVVDIIYE